MSAVLRARPKNRLTTVDSLETPDYIQVTGTGDFTKINIRAGDTGGEMDPHGREWNPVSIALTYVRHLTATFVY